MNRPGDDLGPARPYALGHSDREIERLSAQARLICIVMFAASHMETSLMLGAMTLLCILGTGVYRAVVLLEIRGSRYGRPRAT